MKWISLIVLLLLDVLVLPSILMIPSYLAEHGGQAISVWFSELNIFEAIKAVINDSIVQKLWLTSQLLLIALLIMIFWTDTPRKKNRVQDGVGGPDAAGQGQYGTSRWQDEKEVDRTTTVWRMGQATEKGGLVLGVKEKKDQAWIVTEDFHSIIIGATRSGKSRRLVFPTIWQLAHAGESMILTDPKGELHERSADYLKNNGYNVVVLDFREPGRGNRWNPMDPVIQAINSGDLSRAAKEAWSIAHMFVHQTPGSNKGDQIWNNGAESVIASLILAVAQDAEKDEQKHMTSVYRTLAELGETKKVMMGNSIIDVVPLNDYMSSLPADHPARDAFATARLAPERTRGSFYATVSALLRLFSDPALAYLTAKQDHDLKQIGQEKTAVFLIIPDEDTTRHSLAALYVDQAYQALVELANDNKGRIPVRVNNILDEFGNMPTIKDFDTMLTVSGGRGIRWNLILQDFQQLKKAYPDTYKTIQGNCHTWIYLLTQDAETAKDISIKCGKYTIETDSSSVNMRGYEASRGRSMGLTGRDLLTTDEVMRWPENKSLVIRSRQFPARLSLPDLSKWPADKELVYMDHQVDRHLGKVEFFVPDLIEDTTDSEESDYLSEEEDGKSGEGFFLDGIK